MPPISTAAPQQRLAARMSGIDAFYVMELQARAHALEAAGRDIVHMEIGQPDFSAPQFIVDAGFERLRRDGAPYTGALGLPELRSAIADFYARRFGISVAPSRIVLTTGGSAALLLALGALVGPGDEVLVPDPSYPCNRHMARFAGAETRALRVDAANRFQPTAGQVAADWRESCRLLMLASPANPTGTSVPAAALPEILRVVAERGGNLLMDEIYQGLHYVGPPHSALNVSDQVFVVNSFSKYFQMTGWRLGWLVVPEAYQRAVEKLAQNLYICPPTVAQYVALHCFSGVALDEFELRRAEFERRREFLLPQLQRLGFEIPAIPDGAFYVYADCRRLCDDTGQFALDLLDHAGVAVTPGMDFGQHDARRFMRFAYTTSMPRLEEAVSRIERHLAAGS